MTASGSQSEAGSSWGLSEGPWHSDAAWWGGEAEGGRGKQGRSGTLCSVFLFQENSECSASPISGLETCFTSNHCFLTVGFGEEKYFTEGSRESFSLCRERVLVFSALAALSLNWSQVSPQANPGFSSALSQDLHEVACQVLTSQVQDGTGESIVLIDGYSVDTLTPESITMLLVKPETSRDSTAWLAMYMTGVLTVLSMSWVIFYSWPWGPGEPL